jgi:hypothetical protein
MEDKSVSKEDLYSLVMIDKIRKVKTIITLKDSEGDEIPVRETAEKLVEYIADKVKDEEGNACKQQVMPLMSQAMVAGMIKMMGMNDTQILLCDAVTRNGLMYMMTMSFYLLKWIQQKNIKIFSEEFSLSDNEMAEIERVSFANDTAMKYARACGDPRDAIRIMLEKGLIKREDLATMGAEDLDVDQEVKEEVKVN